MKNSKSNRPSAPNPSKKRKTRKPNARDPFSRPPHPLGINFLNEERPIRAVKFNALLPSIVAKYGLGRSLSAEKYQNAWREALRRVFEQEDDFADYYAEENDGAPNKLETFLKYTRPVSFRGGALRVEIASNLLYQELQFYQTQLVAELRALLPNEQIEKIKAVVK